MARPGKTIGGITTRDIRAFAVPSCVGSRADGTRLGGVSPGAKFPEVFEDAGSRRMVADCVWIGGRTPPKGIDVKLTCSEGSVGDTRKKNRATTLSDSNSN